MAGTELTGLLYGHCATCGKDVEWARNGGNRGKCKTCGATRNIEDIVSLGTPLPALTTNVVNWQRQIAELAEAGEREKLEKLEWIGYFALHAIVLVTDYCLFVKVNNNPILSGTLAGAMLVLSGTFLKGMKQTYTGMQKNIAAMGFATTLMFAAGNAFLYYSLLQNIPLPTLLSRYLTLIIGLQPIILFALNAAVMAFSPKAVSARERAEIQDHIDKLTKQAFKEAVQTQIAEQVKQVAPEMAKEFVEDFLDKKKEEGK